MRRSTSIVCALTLVATALLTTSACGGEEVTVVAAVDGPPAVEWVYTSEWRPYSGGGRGSLPIPTKYESQFLRIATNPQQEITVDCHTPEPQLAVESTRQLVSYRCGSTAPWRVIHLGDPTVTDPSSELGNGAQPDWTKTPTLEVSVVKVINDGLSSTRVQRYLDRVHQTGGKPAVTSVLIATASASAWFEHGTRGEPTGEWHRNYSELAPDQMRTVQEGLKHALDSPDANWRLVRIALLVLPTTDQVVTTRLVATARKLLEHNDPEVAPVARKVALQAASTNPAVAAELVCKILGGRWARDDADLLVLAATGVKCEHALKIVTCERLLESKSCDESDTWRLCAKDELEKRVAAEFDGWKRSAPAENQSLDRSDYLLSIAYTHGAVPAELDTAARLRGYAVVQPDEPECSNFMIKKDMPCKCWHFAEVKAPVAYRGSLCEAAAVTPNEPFTTKASSCRIEIDDKNRKIKVLGFKRLTGVAPVAQSPDASTTQ